MTQYHWNVKPDIIMQIDDSLPPLSFSGEITCIGFFKNPVIFGFLLCVLTTHYLALFYCISTFTVSFGVSYHLLCSSIYITQRLSKERCKVNF